MTGRAAARRWVPVAAAWLAVAGLAYWGLSAGDPDRSAWDRLYALPGFFGFWVSDADAASDGRVQVARFLGPIVLAVTLGLVLAALCRLPLDRLRLRFAKGHVVVAGLGEKGSRLAMSFADAGRRVVVIDPDPANPKRVTIARHRVTVVTGRASDPEVLRAAGVARAADLVAVADDAGNAEIVAAAIRLERDRSLPALRASVHLLDPHLSRLLRTRELAEGDGVELDFFNVFQRGARLWLAETDPFTGRADGRPPHLVVIGMGALGEALAVAAAQRWAERRDDAATASDPLRLTVIDPDASARFRSLRLRHPALLGHTRAEAIDFDPDRPQPDAADAFGELLAEASVTAVYVCHEDDTAALSAALFVRMGLGASDTLVAVRTRSEGGLALLESQGRRQVGIRGFPLFDRTCSAEAIEGGTNEAVARALHVDHVTRARAAGRQDPTVVPWDDLDDATRASNLAAADNLIGALAAVDCGLAPLYCWDAPGFELDDEKIERLARAAHVRWLNEHRQAGWTHHVVRDDARKRHPLLVGWAELPERERVGKRAASAELPTILARAGFEVVRLDP